MSEAEFQREDREYERQRDHREELEREDILSIAVTPWLKAVTLTRSRVPSVDLSEDKAWPLHRESPRAPQPVAALLDSITDEWEAA